MSLLPIYFQKTPRSEKPRGAGGGRGGEGSRSAGRLQRPSFDMSTRANRGFGTTVCPLILFSIKIDAIK